MAIAIKRILLVTRNVQFAIDIKRTLESLGEYAVTTVTEARNAIEQLRRKPHHLVLLDVEDLSIAPSVMIDLIRARQGEIAIVLAPDNSSVHELASSYRAQGVVDIPASTRSLIPVLEGSLRDIYDALPQTLKLPAVDLREDTVRIEALVDELLGDEALPSYTLRRLQASYRLLHPDDDSNAIGTSLDSVELVIESDDHGETVRYRRTGQGSRVEKSAADLQAVAEEDTPLTTRGEQTTVRDFAQAVAKSSSEASDTVSSVPAGEASDGSALRRALQEALDENTTIDKLSLLTFHENIKPGSRGEVSPKPSWLRESEKFVREPGFLPEQLPPLQPVPAIEQTTAPADLNNDEDMATTIASNARFSLHDHGGTTANPVPGNESQVPLRSHQGDPLVNQLAVIMTQMMTELTADATVLTRDDTMVAFSGELSLDDFKALRDAIKDDWAAQPDRARLRFLTVPAAGQEYMLYSKGTVGGLTLSLVFAGSKPLSAISKQGDKMLHALAKAADAEDDPAGSRAVDAVQGADLGPVPIPKIAQQSVAFVWLVADPALQLSETVANQLVFWLEVQLNSLAWTIYRLDVHQDFVYLLADVPAVDAPEQLIHDLMDRSLRIVRSEDGSLPSDLWADAYLVLQPGRELNTRELKGFLQFARDDG